MMDTAFEVCFNRIIKAESGFVDHPMDHGGPTNFGITLKSLSAFRGKPQTTLDVKNLTLLEAKQFYKETFWFPLRLREINSIAIAVLLMDQAVNRGAKAAVMNAQTALRLCGLLYVDGDGIIGDDTVGALNKVNYKAFGLAYFKVAQEGYIKICQKDPSQNVFLLGWIRRTHDLLDRVLK